MLPGPGLDQPVQLLDVRASRLVVGKAWIVRQLGATQGRAEPPKDGIAVGADRDESSVAGRVHVGGGRAQQHVPSTLANGTRVPVLGKDAFEEAENRLVKGHVNDLTAARVGAPL